MPEEIKETNIPAYQRKRSISARARKKPSYMKAIKKPKKTTRARRTTARATLKNHLIEEIPIVQTTHDEEIFENPIIENTSAETELREMKTCGKCDGYFDNIDVAVVKVSSPLRVGDRIIFETDTGLFEQTINSMQVNKKDVQLARTGSDIGLKVLLPPLVGTSVYKVI